VLAYRLLIAEIVILLQQAVEQPFFRRAAHLRKLQWSEAVKWSAHRTIVGDDWFGALPLCQ
jgi:hypothetical protein